MADLENADAPQASVSDAAEKAAEEAEEALFRAEVRAVRRKIMLGMGASGAASVLLCWGVCVGYPCFSTGLRYGMWLDQCPTSDLRLDLQASVHSAVRGGEGSLMVYPSARLMRGKGSRARVEQYPMYRGYDLDFSLVDGDGEPVAGAVITEEKQRGDGDHFAFTLPGEIPDGDYVLKVTAATAFETLSADVKLPLYAPAIAHVATDRPLYKPGQEVKLRSVLLKRTDRTPLDERPGRWEITSPSGDQMLKERDRAGIYGVADTSFPLDSRAEVGTWTATYISGDASDSVTFDVRPFQLPRFAVEVKPDARWYGVSDTIAIEGTATYTSGAPVADAPVTIDLRVSEGRWPMPLDWEETFTAKTDRYGHFSVEVGEVPADLLERSVLAARASVTEQAGGRITGATKVILSKDDLVAEAVTELGDGLVGGFNNRAYVRVKTPDGKPIPGANVKLRPAYDETADVKEAVADEDGVAAFQIDPGDPVTVVIPAAPVRERPFEPQQPSLQNGSQIMTGASLTMAERRALDAAIPALRKCGDFTVGGRTTTMGVRVSTGGAVTTVMNADDRASSCAAAAVRGVRFGSGAERTYQLTWSLADSLRPWLTVSTRMAHGTSAAVDKAFTLAAEDARRCMPFGSGASGATVATVHWSQKEGSRFIDTRLETRASATGLSASQVSCIGGAIARAQLDEVSTLDTMGASTFTIQTPRRPGSRENRPTTQTAYELAIAADVDGSKIGDTKLIVQPGSIPNMRLRATPSLASPGSEVVIDLLRGPSWRGDLPKELELMEGTSRVAKAKVDQDAKRVTFAIPSDVDGFLHVEYAGARAVIFVRPAKPLSVALSTDQDVYRPGETATLTVTTMAGATPTSAGVGLMGVDSTLAQLAPLLGPDEWGRVTVRATSDRPAFESFDPKALTLGQVRGENAAKAAVLRISQLPMDYAGDQRLSASGAAVHNDLEVLTRNFYRALTALHDATGAWEDAAAPSAIMSNSDMAKLWDGVLKDLDKQGTPAVDAFGRPLDLKILPWDLLAQCDPRQVVSDATHLPEDIEDWTAWVAEQGRTR